MDGSGGAGAARPDVSRSVSAILDVVAELWPAAEPPRLVRRIGPVGPRQLLLVPHARSPRLLVPSRPACAAGAMDRYSAALSGREALQRWVLGRALRTGLGLGIPHRVALGAMPDGPSIEEHLASVLGEPVRVSLGLGNERANRKPVLQVFDLAGHSRAFVKIGDSEVARGHVAGEVAALRSIESHRWSLVHPPVVRHAGTWREAYLAVLSPLGSRPWRRSPDAASWRASEREVFESAPVSWAMLGETLAWRRATDQAHRLGGPWADRARVALERAAARIADRTVEVGAWHGDWTPWNVCRAHGALQVWDWERYEVGVPWGLDAAHRHVNVALRGRPGEPGLVARALTASVEMAPDRSVARTAATTYLVVITMRYLEAAELPGGDLIADRATLMLDALERDLAEES